MKIGQQWYNGPDSSDANSGNEGMPFTTSLFDSYLQQSSIIEIDGYEELGIKLIKQSDGSSFPLEEGEHYYLKFIFNRKAVDLEVSLILKDSQKLYENDFSQVVTSFLIPAEDEDNSTFEYDCLVTPYADSDEICFRVDNRKTQPITIVQQPTHNGAAQNILLTEEIVGTIELTGASDSLIINKLTNQIPTDDGVSCYTKIGIWGNPGLTFCLNGEEIMLGKSGYYETLNGFMTYFLTFIIRNSEDRYILDYQYE